jgi:hypothetical protein
VKQLSLALPLNIRLGWKSLPGAITPAYYKNPEIKAVKNFMTQALGLDALFRTKTNKGLTNF